MNQMMRQMIFDRIDAELKNIPHEFGEQDVNIKLEVTIKKKGSVQ